jgi:type II secretory pathway component PulM
MKFKSERERWMVIIGSIALTVILYVAFFLSPTLKQIGKYQKLLPQRKTELDDARKLAGQYMQMKAASKGPAVVDKDPISAVDDVAQQMGMKDRVRIVNSSGNGGFQLKVDDVDGGSLVKLLHNLASRGVRPDDIEMHDYDGTGFWTVTFTKVGEMPGTK